MKLKKKDLDGPRDIISGLDDTLICHILSFLPTREAASTSVLAKRWKHLLAFVHNLDFDFFYFHPARTCRIWSESSESYLDFVDSVLALQAQANAPVDRFHLKCPVVEAYWLLNWIDNVLKRGISDLDLYISSPWPSSDSIYYLLPSEMYVSKTLVKLKIRFIGGVFIKYQDDSGENMDVRTCLSSSSVKVQKILKFGKTFNDDDDDTKKHIEQVKHFIETTPNLEQLILYYNTPNTTNDEYDPRNFRSFLEIIVLFSAMHMCLATSFHSC